MFHKILIANRGEIALRILRACREMGIRSVAVHSTADANAMHVRLADESICIGPPPAAESYLNPVAILLPQRSVPRRSIRYGFLSENADFAAMVEEHGIIFISPAPEHIRMMGDKITAKKVCSTPVFRSSRVPTGRWRTRTRRAVAETVGFPVMVKAAAGGGGRGMKVVDAAAELAPAMAMARAEALAAFGNGELYLEKYLVQPRHIEVQILADLHGTVHLGERDCSLQRRHQKVLEEAPSPRSRRQARRASGDSRRRQRQIWLPQRRHIRVPLRGGEFYFIEMNTRLQVEHPVTEMVCGLDLVREMLRVAAGVPLGFGQNDIRFSGHAIECRINAEEPADVRAMPSRVTDYHAPGGLGSDRRRAIPCRLTTTA